MYQCKLHVLAVAFAMWFVAVMSVLPSSASAGEAAVTAAQSMLRPHEVERPGPVEPSETPELRERFAGLIVTVAPVGGIVALDLASGRDAVLRAKNSGFSAVHELSEPDEQGRVIFVTASRGFGRGYDVNLLERNGERMLFQGRGDPLWDHAISPVSFAPQGGAAAFVVQPPEKEEERFRPLTSGPLRVWDLAAGSVRDTGITALGERPSWFPDGRRIAYAQAARTGACATCTAHDAVVRVLDTGTGEDTIMASGHLPIVSSDGKTVLVTRGRNFELSLLDVASRSEKRVARIHGMGTPIALIDSRYIIYKGRPTPGAPTGVTTNNSPFVGPKAMLAIKLVDLQTQQFVTLVPQIDPRSSVTALVKLRAS